ncbi:MAG: histidine phosphatase family protein [Pseudomonadota bacterium]
MGLLRAIFPVIVAVAMACPIAAQPDNGQLEIYIVRHAEKVRTGDSAIDNNCQPGPSLTDAGFDRALALRSLFSEARLDGVFSTNCLRTLQTGLLTASDQTAEGERPVSSGETYQAIQIYDAPAVLASQLREVSGRYLVIGHSNTVGAIIEALGTTYEGGAVASRENDRLYKITRSAEGDFVAEGPCSFGTPFERPEGRELYSCEPVL